MNNSVEKWAKIQITYDDFFITETADLCGASARRGKISCFAFKKACICSNAKDFILIQTEPCFRPREGKVDEVDSYA